MLRYLSVHPQAYPDLCGKTDFSKAEYRRQFEKIRGFTESIERRKTMGDYNDVVKAIKELAEEVKDLKIQNRSIVKELQEINKNIKNKK